VPPGLSADLPAGSSVVSESALASGLLNNPLSDVPQQAMLGIALAALLLACTGFCVSIAAGVQQRRPENALLAALVLPAATARTSGSAARAPSSTLAIRGSANSAVSTSVSVEGRRPGKRACSPSAPLAMAASSRVLIRLPLWPRARLATGVDRKVGWAFSQVEAPLVE